jgi:hypothetical protein
MEAMYSVEWSLTVITLSVLVTVGVLTLMRVLEKSLGVSNKRPWYDIFDLSDDGKDLR